MNWQEALEIIVDRNGHQRFRWLCSDDNPDAHQREGYRAIVISQATGKPPIYPSLFQQATNLAHAAGSVVASAARGEAVTVSGGEQNRRMMICKTCDKFDIDSSRCRICGCFANLKTRLASQHCPDDPPKW